MESDIRVRILRRAGSRGYSRKIFSTATLVYFRKSCKSKHIYTCSRVHMLTKRICRRYTIAVTSAWNIHIFSLFRFFFTFKFTVLPLSPPLYTRGLRYFTVYGRRGDFINRADYTRESAHRAASSEIRCNRASKRCPYSYTVGILPRGNYRRPANGPPPYRARFSLTLARAALREHAYVYSRASAPVNRADPTGQKIKIVTRFSRSAFTFANYSRCEEYPCAPLIAPKAAAAPER